MSYAAAVVVGVSPVLDDFSSLGHGRELVAGEPLVAKAVVETRQAAGRYGQDFWGSRGNPVRYAVARECFASAIWFRGMFNIAAVLVPARATCPSCFGIFFRYQRYGV